MIRAHKLTARPLTARKLIAYKLGQMASSFNILSLWGDSEKGTFFDFNTTSTAPGTLNTNITSATDLSGNSATGTTGATKPILREASGVQSAQWVTGATLTLTLPAITGGTVALVGLSGIWIEDDWDYAGGTLSIGPTTIAGLPDGILSVVGNLCAVIINDRPWTAAERAGVVAWGKARGAPGVFGLGPELVTNGTFDTDVSGWTAFQATTSVTSGEVAVTRSAVPGVLYQSFPTTIGDTYLMVGEILANGGTYWGIRKSDNAAAPVTNIVTIIQNTTGVGKAIFSATATATYVALQVNNGTATFDNISARKLELIP